jgi:hypothetical protein
LQSSYVITKALTEQHRWQFASVKQFYDGLTADHAMIKLSLTLRRHPLAQLLSLQQLPLHLFLTMMKKATEKLKQMKKTISIC